jgi:hypothetical protein
MSDASAHSGDTASSTAAPTATKLQASIRAFKLLLPDLLGGDTQRQQQFETALDNLLDGKMPRSRDSRAALSALDQGIDRYEFGTAESTYISNIVQAAEDMAKSK